MFDQEKYLKAWLFAAEKHQDQKYPGGELPYLTHIGCVVMEVIANTKHIDNINLAISCAILHDTIEDTETTFDELVNIFSVDIAKGVMALTKNSKLPTKQERMIDSLERIIKQPTSVWVVKLADRISNLNKPPHHWDIEKIQHYVKEAELILSYLGTANKSLAQRLEDKIKIYQEKYC